MAYKRAILRMGGGETEEKEKIAVLKKKELQNVGIEIICFGRVNRYET